MIHNLQGRATLGVKLGHRRALFRYIATLRGSKSVAAKLNRAGHPSHEPLDDAVSTEQESIQSPTSPPASMLNTAQVPGRLPIYNSDISPSVASGTTSSVPQKRRYKRHPRPDENAPQRPPSAYVMYANRVREEQRDANLNFTQLARLVGDRWKVISASEKEAIEAEAAEAKRQYTMAVERYKKSPEFKQYQGYLAEFKERALRDERPEKLEPPRKAAFEHRADIFARYNYASDRANASFANRNILPIASILGSPGPARESQNSYNGSQGPQSDLAGYHLGMRAQSSDSYSRHLPFPVPSINTGHNNSSSTSAAQTESPSSVAPTQHISASPGTFSQNDAR